MQLYIGGEHRAVKIMNGVCLTHCDESDVVNAGFSRKWETRLKRALGLMDFAPRQASSKYEYEQWADSAVKLRRTAVTLHGITT